VRGRRLTRGAQATVEIVERALEHRIGDRACGAFVEVVARRRDPVTVSMGRSRSAS
jgi:hypothetical protein